MRLRVLLGGLGVLVGVYGAWLLLTRQDSDQLLSAAIWLGGGVVRHDFVLAPVVLGLVFIGALVIPSSARVPAVTGLVVLGAATLLAIPVLTGFGDRSTTDALLDRNYWVSWLVVAGLTVLVVVVATLVRQRHRGSSGVSQP